MAPCKSAAGERTFSEAVVVGTISNGSSDSPPARTQKAPMPKITSRTHLRRNMVYSLAQQSTKMRYDPEYSMAWPRPGQIKNTGQQVFTPVWRCSRSDPTVRNKSLLTLPKGAALIESQFALISSELNIYRITIARNGTARNPNRTQTSWRGRFSHIPPILSPFL